MWGCDAPRMDYELLENLRRVEELLERAQYRHQHGHTEPRDRLLIEARKHLSQIVDSLGEVRLGTE